MDRRNFFRHIASRTADAALEHARERAEARARHWFRPPFARPELDFLLACTRCGECISACPHQVIFPLAARLGADVAGSPALDLLHHGCHLCADWPCVAACEADALKLPERPEGESLIVPRLSQAHIDTETCLPYQGPECGACVSICPVEGALVLQSEKPIIDENLCVGCALCRAACVVETKSILVSTFSPDAAAKED